MTVRQQILSLMRYYSPSLDIWPWHAQAHGPHKVIMLNPDGLDSMRPLALMAPTRNFTSCFPNR